jgi:hypothetical protein
MTVFDLWSKRDKISLKELDRYLNEPRLSSADLSRAWCWSAGVVEWLMAPGCKPGGLRLYEGSNPSPSTTILNAAKRQQVKKEECFCLLSFYFALTGRA